MDEVIVEISKLSKVFRDFWLRPVTQAVCDIDLTVMRGETFGLLGPNGSGKSTTIKMILGLLHPSGGHVRVFGENPASCSVRKRIGYLPELSRLHPFLTARETVLYYAALSGLVPRLARERTERFLARTGIQDVASRTVGSFSKGMARRVAFASALVGEPEFLVLDEPTSGLDPLGVRDVKKLISELSARGVTILITSHQLFDMQDVCSRVAILAQGKVVAHGSVAEIVTNARDKRHALEDYFADSLENNH